MVQRDEETSGRQHQPASIPPYSWHKDQNYFLIARLTYVLAEKYFRFGAYHSPKNRSTKSILAFTGRPHA